MIKIKYDSKYNRDKTLFAYELNNFLLYIESVLMLNKEIKKQR